jgi:hypothetical protein
MADLMFSSGFQRPEVDEIIGVPEIFCDLTLVETRDETVRIMLAVERRFRANAYELVGRLVMPKRGFIFSKKFERIAELDAMQ